METHRRKLTNIERIGVSRITSCYQTVPHFTAAVDIDMGALLNFKHQLNLSLIAKGTRLSVTAILVKVVALCLRRHDYLNACFEPPDTILFQPQVNVGVAVDTPRGLVVPVLKQADERSLMDLAAEFEQLMHRAREGRLHPDDVSGGTFTISNLGMMGVEWFSAIINPPQSSILAVGAIVNKPVAVSQGVEVRPILTMTLTSDHRVVDGAKAARFLLDIKSTLDKDGTLPQALET